MGPERAAEERGERCAACDQELTDRAAFAACRACLAPHHIKCWPEGARCARCAGAEPFRAGAPKTDDPDALPEPPPGSIIAARRHRPGAIELRWPERAGPRRWWPSAAALGLVAALASGARLADGFDPGDAAFLAVVWLAASIASFVIPLALPERELVRLRLGPRGLSLGRGPWWLACQRSFAWSDIDEVFIEEDPKDPRLVLRSRGRRVLLTGGEAGGGLTRKDRGWLLVEILSRRG